MESVDCLVIGAGVVGLAVARALAQAGHEVVVAEAAPTFGTGVSSRSSEVVHAGMYYSSQSLKARLCVAGRRRLYDYCVRHGVAHRRCGKLVVATSEAQTAALEAWWRRGRDNGVEGLAMLTRREARALEPELECKAALVSPETGIVDSHGFMAALLADAEAAGAACAWRSPVVGGEIGPDGMVVEVGGAEPMALRASCVVNAAGLGAPAVARALRGVVHDEVPAMFLAKGSYFALGGRCPFGRLIYPLPEAGGLGVHLTLDLAGQARFGPDVEWIAPPGAGGLDLRVDPARGAAFAEQVRKYWPALSDGALQPAYAGVRPKLHGPGEPDADFMIAGPAEHGVPGLVHLYGIESPGLTAALALADEVCVRLGA